MARRASCSTSRAWPSSNSSGLGAVVAVRKFLGPDRVLELAGLTPAVEKVFRLTRMDSVFVIHPELPDRPDGLRDAG